MTASRRLLVDELKTIASEHDHQVDFIVALGDVRFYLDESATEASQSGEDDRVKDFSDRSDRCSAAINIAQEAQERLIQELNDKGFPEFATALQKRCYRSLVDND
jgi:hypothetical protein